MTTNEDLHDITRVTSRSEIPQILCWASLLLHTDNLSQVSHAQQEPCYAPTNHDPKDTPFKWTDVFAVLKRLLTKDPLLVLPDFQRTFNFKQMIWGRVGGCPRPETERWVYEANCLCKLNTVGT